MDNSYPGLAEPVAPDGEVVTGAHARVELVGIHLRVAGGVRLGHFSRVSDMLNVRSWLEVTDAVLVAGPGQETQVVFPELRVNLDDISVVGQRDDVPAGDDRQRIALRRRHLVVMTRAHMIYGWAHLHPETSLAAFVETVDRRFLPMTDVRVRWLADRSLAARYPFALIQRSHIIGVATAVHSPTVGPGVAAPVEVPAVFD
jgi:hypothetical protein